MTLTDSSPAHADLTDNGAASAEPAGGYAAALASTDHKNTGRLFVAFGALGALFGVVLAVLVAIENADISAVDLFSFGGESQTFFQAWSLAQISLVFFGLLPMVLGLAIFVVPLQVGASSLTFPRAAAAAFWTWLVGAGMHIASVAIDGGLGDPTSTANAIRGTERDATELALLSFGVVIIALLLALTCVMATIITQRPVGMSLFEVPLFSWSMLVAGGIWVLSLPVLLANVAIAWIDFRGADALLYGSVRVLWDQVSWGVAQPQIFTLAVPVLGIVAETVAVASGRPQKGRGILMFAIGMLGFLSFGAYAQRFFSPEVEGQPLYVITGLLLVVPMLLVLGGLADTIRNGRPKLHAHLVLAVLAMLGLLAAAGIAFVRVLGPALGVIREYDDNALSGLIDPLEDLGGSVAATALAYQVGFAVLVGIAAGVYYWGPKMFGRTLSAGAGILGGLAMLAGGTLFGLALLINGFLHMPERVFDAFAFGGVEEVDAVEALNLVSAIGAAIVALGLLLVIGDLFASSLLGRRGAAADNPWGGHTLEWATSSPPPPGNFAEVPTVTSATPLLTVEEDL